MDVENYDHSANEDPRPIIFVIPEDIDCPENLIYPIIKSDENPIIYANRIMKADSPSVLHASKQIANFILEHADLIPVRLIILERLPDGDLDHFWLQLAGSFDRLDYDNIANFLALEDNQTKEFKQEQERSSSFDKPAVQEKPADETLVPEDL